MRLRRIGLVARTSGCETGREKGLHSCEGPFKFEARSAYFMGFATFLTTTFFFAGFLATFFTTTAFLTCV